MTNQNFVAVRFAVAVVAITVLISALTVIPSMAQVAAPSAARRAADPGSYAPLVMQPAPPQGARRSPASARARRALPQDSVLYSNGPANLNNYAWQINLGYAVSNSIPLSGANTITGLDFYAWEYPGDKALSVDWSISSEPFGGTVYGSGTASVTDTFLSYNQYGYQIDLISVGGLSVTVQAGTAWLNLQNASTALGQPLYWDENSGPSQAYDNTVGTIPSESFDVTGNGALHSACDTRNADSTPSQPTGTYNVIYQFTNADGGFPYATTTDRVGNVYGTTAGICYGCDGRTAFRLSNLGSGWVLNPLYQFSGTASARTIGPEGALYGWAKQEQRCNGGDCVVDLKPPPTAPRSVFDPWQATEIYSWNFDSNDLGRGDFAFDRAGNIYGSVRDGGANGVGMVYKLTPSSAGWTQTVLYSFSGGNDGASVSPVVMDAAGNLYGTTNSGGIYGGGTVFQLSPSGGAWTRQTLHDFQNAGDGIWPVAGLTMDGSGNLYGATTEGDDYPEDGPTVFELTPSAGGWTFNIIRRLNYLFNYGPRDRLAVDAAGNVYGTTVSSCGSNRPTRPAEECSLYQHYYWGEVFELSPSDGQWKCTVLHNFNGYDPLNLSLDAHGNLYGTSISVVWEITP